MLAGEDRKLARIRARVERYGLRVVCLGCGARGRHRPSFDGRLRLRSCPNCGGALRSLAWALAPKNRAKVRVAAEAERALVAILATTRRSDG